MVGSNGAGALSFSHTLRKGLVMGSSVHSMDESTEVSENPTRDTIVESDPSKNDEWGTRPRRFPRHGSRLELVNRLRFRARRKSRPCKSTYPPTLKRYSTNGFPAAVIP